MGLSHPVSPDLSKGQLNGIISRCESLLGFLIALERDPLPSLSPSQQDALFCWPPPSGPQEHPSAVSAHPKLWYR